MQNAVIINKQCQNDFIINRNSLTLERYAMSELLSPIEDYENVLDLVKNNFDIIEGNNLIYIASYLCSEWTIGENLFLEELNKNIESEKNKNKAIVYYLNSIEINSRQKNTDCYKSFLEKSIFYSKNIKFVNNYYDLSLVSDEKTSKYLLKKAKENVLEICTLEMLNKKPVDYWLDSNNYINEFILGTSLSYVNYDRMFNRSY